jgi:drug/metabolite transporter (DMT)-like permease
LGFNTYPLWIALWARLLYKHQPEPAVLRVMPIMLIGLALALDVLGASSGLGAQGQWAVMGEGVFFALAAAALFGIAMVLTQHEAGDLDGRVRTLSTMICVAILAWLMIGTQTGLHLPDASEGWLGLCMLSLLYGTGFTIMFTVLPRLGVVGNSAIMNVEPVFALILAWILLDQEIAPIQLVGALVVVSTVMYLGLRKR